MGSLGNKCPEKRSELKRKHFFKIWPEVKIAVQPDFINWNNVGSTGKERFCWSLFSWSVAVLLMIIAIFLIVMFKSKRDSLKNEFGSGDSCPTDVISLKELAYSNFIAGEKSLLSCFCKASFSELGPEASNISFQEFNANLPADESYLCQQWKDNQNVQ